MVKNRLSAAGVLVLSLLLWSCDDSAQPTQPGLTPSPMVVTSTSGTSFVVASEPSPTAGSVSATIDSSGGVLVLGKHVLWVASDAVSAATTFRMTRDLEHPLRVKLTATRVTENDVGQAGFAAPVYLGLSYADAASVPRDESVVEVIYFRPDGLVEEMPSAVYADDNRIVAKLSHFSAYGVGWP